MIEILTDSCSDLSADLIQRFGIKVIPLNVFINEKTFKDGTELKIEQLFDYVSRTGQLPKTSAPSLAEFSRFFQNIKQGIFIGISQKLSATHDVAFQAANSLRDQDIRIIDSKNLSTGIGLLVIKAAELRDQGKSISEIETAIKESISKVQTSFSIDTLDYLYKGGRCTAMENIVGSMLRIRPIIEVRSDGTLGVKEKTSGTRKKALLTMVKNFEKDILSIDLHRVFITHTGCFEDADFIKTEILAITPIDEIHQTLAGATIASHCGPNTIGILYTLK
jgi:DegV family protein with EDD domain